MDLPEELKRQRTADLIAEFIERRNQGEPVDARDMMLRHPDLAEELSRSLSGLRVLDQLVAQTGLPGAGDVVDDFVIGREIGRGGSAVVYEATQVSMERRVALKILPRGALPPERLRREVEIAGRLHHPHIVPLLATGQGSGFYWIAMVLAGGGTLATVLARCRVVPPAERGAEHLLAQDWHVEQFGNPREYFRRVAEIGAAIAEALQHAHERGILHRDVKPSNVVFTEDGVPRLVDFGLATRHDADRITGIGEMLGTPAYLPPEVIEGEEDAPSRRSDIYSLGAMLYEMMLLELPFRAKTTRALLAAIVSKDPTPPRKILGFIPRDLETICLKCLEKQPESRYQSAAELATDLQRFFAGRPILARPPGFAARVMRLLRRNLVATAFFLLSSVLVILLVTILVKKSIDVSQSRSIIVRQLMDEADGCVEKIGSSVEQYRDFRARLDAAHERRNRLDAAGVDDLVYFNTESEGPVLEEEIGRQTRLAERALERVTSMVEPDQRQLISPVWADLYLARWRWAVETGNLADRRRFRALVLEHDDGSRRAEIETPGRVVFLLDGEPGIAAYLHRYAGQFRLRPGGDMRQVPVPCDRSGNYLLTVDESRVLPEPDGERPAWLLGDTLLEVLKSTERARELRRGDQIIEVEKVAAGRGTFAASSQSPLMALDAVLSVGGRRVELAEQVRVLARDAIREGVEEVDIEVSRGGALRKFRLSPSALAALKLARFDDLLATGLPRGAIVRVRRGLEHLGFTMPAGLRDVRTSREAYPLFQHWQNRVEAGEALDLQPGSYLALVQQGDQLDGASCRLPFVVRPNADQNVVLRSWREKSIPEGFVLVQNGTGPMFAMQRFEVSFQEYLEFLDSQRGAVDSSLLPFDDASNRFLVERVDSRWRLAAESGQSLDSPVVGVSRVAARAYISWWNEKHRTSDGMLRAHLPAEVEFVRAGLGADDRTLPFGRVFAYRFLDGVNSHYGADIMARRGDFPTDESPYGVRGLAGGASEWLRGGTDLIGRVSSGRSTSDLEGRFDLRAVYAAPDSLRSIHHGFRMVVDLER